MSVPWPVIVLSVTVILALIGWAIMAMSWGASRQVTIARLEEKLDAHARAISELVKPSDLKNLSLQLQVDLAKLFKDEFYTKLEAGFLEQRLHAENKMLEQRVESMVFRKEQGQQ